MMACFKRYLDPLSPHKLKKTKQKTSRIGPPLTKLSVSVHGVLVIMSSKGLNKIILMC